MRREPRVVSRSKMLKKLDIYIIKKYLSTFLFTVMIFSLIAVVIDFSEKVEEFIDESLGPYQVLTEYYIHFILFINARILPLYVLLSVIFFTSRLASNTEIISMLSAGISFRRIMLPYLTAAGIVMVFHLFANHWLVPKANEQRLDFEHAYVWKESDKGNTRDVHMFLTPDTKIFVRDYHKRDSIGRKFRLEHFDGIKMDFMLKAEKITWKGDPDKWQLEDYEIRTFDGLNETIRVGLKEKLDTTISLHPTDFVRYDDTKDQIPSNELSAFIAEEKRRGIGNTKVYEVEFHRRTADAIAILIVTLIGMTLAARKVRGGMGLHLATGVILGAIFIFLSQFSMTFAQKESLSAFWGVWIPNIVFGIIAAVLISKAQK